MDGYYQYGLNYEYHEVKCVLLWIVSIYIQRETIE